jgi:Rrf2 family cysteine metabolism transcriptional repressor
MKFLTKNTDYAVRGLLVLAGSPESYISAREISDNQDIPYQYLRKIMQKLIEKKLIESKEGGKGGFKLKGSPSKIKVADLVDIFQGEVQLLECMFRKKICKNRATCVLRKNVLKIEQLVVSEFGKITIASLLKEMNG